MAPLVDVAFLLIIFFVLATSYDFQTGYHVQAPKVKNAPIVVGDKLLVVLSKVEGKDECGLFFNNQAYEWKDFDYGFSAAVHNRTYTQKKTKRRPVISLRVDGDVAYKYVMRVISLAYKQNLELNQLVDDEKATQ